MLPSQGVTTADKILKGKIVSLMWGGSSCLQVLPLGFAVKAHPHPDVHGGGEFQPAIAGGGGDSASV
jgi:hypothetical protein